MLKLGSQPKLEPNRPGLWGTKGQKEAQADHFCTASGDGREDRIVRFQI